MASVFTLEVMFTKLQRASNVRAPNKSHIISAYHAMHIGNRVYNSDDNFKLHSDFRFEFIT